MGEIKIKFNLGIVTQRISVDSCNLFGVEENKRFFRSVCPLRSEPDSLGNSYQGL